MNNPSNLEECYIKFMNDIPKWLPDGILEVNLDLLHKLNLLHFHDPSESTLTRYFHVVDSQDKLTLANEEFVIWIVPEKVDVPAMTYTLIALNKEEDIQLELAFMTKGIYNNSYLVLRLIERFLIDIQGTEELISKLEHSK